MSISEVDPSVASEASAQQIIDYLPIAALVVDDNGNLRAVNSELCELLGYTQTELAGCGLEKLLPESYRGNHRGLVQGYLQDPTKRQMGAGRQLHGLTSNGVEFPVEIGLNPIVVGTQTWVLATLVDLTPRQQADQMFRQSVQVAPHGVLVISEQGIIEIANRVVCETFGYRQLDLVGQPIEILLPGRYRGHHRELRASFTSKPVIRMMGPGRDLTGLHKDGTEFPVEIGLSPFNDVDQRQMVMVSVLDITERKRMELELRETNTNLEEFTYVASHDLRSPLRGIADLLEWVEEDLPSDTPDSVNKNLERAKIRIGRMESLIDNLLTYARAGRIERKIETINVVELLAEVCELVPLPDGFEIQTSVNVNEIESVKTPLETILRNLLSNAVKHHDQTAGEIRIEAKANGSRVDFSVSDDGPGIPESARTRIFKLFQTSSSGHKGSGIGLAVSRRLAETHGGVISVEENPIGRGAVFTVSWPRYVRRDIYD